MKQNWPYIDNRYRLTRWLQKPFWAKVHESVSIDWCWNASAPCTNLTIHKWDIYPENYSVCTFVDDGNEVWIWYWNKWERIMRRKEFNKIVISYIKIWIFHEWFWLRTYIYWKSLHKMCEHYRKNSKPQ